jgi:hypothetical protein
MVSWPLRLAKPGAGWDPAGPGAGHQPCLEASDPAVGADADRVTPGTATQSSRTPASTSSLVPDAVPGLFSCGMLRRANAGVGPAARSRRAWPGGSRGATRSGGPLVPNFADAGNAEPCRPWRLEPSCMHLLVEPTQHLLLQRLGRVRPKQHPSEFVNRYRWFLRHDPGLPEASPAARREAGSAAVSLRRRDHASPISGTPPLRTRYTAANPLVMSRSRPATAH